MEGDPHRLHRASEPIGDLGVEEGEQARAALHERHLHAHRSEHRGVLAADHAASHDEHRLGEAIDHEDRVRVVHVLVVEGDVRRVVRARAGGDEEELARHTPRGTAAARDLDGVRVDEARHTAQDRNPVPLEVPLHACDFLVAHGILAREELGDGELGVELDAQAVELALAEA